MTEGLDPELIAEASRYNKLAVHHITQYQSFRGRLYSSVTLENPASNLVDIVNPAPNLVIATHTTALYWGEVGHPYDPNSKCQIIIHDKRPDETKPYEIQAVKQLILGATVCRAALERASQEHLRVGQALADLVGNKARRLIEDMYTTIGAPAAVMRAGIIARNGRVDNELVGSQIANLWYPPVADPGDILAAIQKLIGDRFQPIHLNL
ncbi:hypothetical protein IRY61_01905 [Candidatus Saccharibacteria bacterium]|nr:hypothetical protein [Candidatus Saccharibacteria bacterium]